jgi:hypothetical protein
MTWTLYDYRDKRDENPVRAWCERLQKPDLARMNQRIDLLSEKGKDFCPGLAGPLRGSPHLYKIKVNGRVAARMILCKGPIDMEGEYTLLLGAFERDDELPVGTLETAEMYRREIILDPTQRRTLHERAKK